MGDNHDAYRPARSINGVHDSKAPDSKPPEPLQFPLEGRPNRRVDADRTQGGLDRPLDVGRKVAQDLGHVRRDVDLEWVHYRERFFASVRGSPKTSSNDRPLPFFA